MTRQSRNSRWSVPSRMWKKPSLTNSHERLVPARIELRRCRCRRARRRRARACRAAGSAADVHLQAEAREARADGEVATGPTRSGTRTARRACPVPRRCRCRRAGVARSDVGQRLRRSSRTSGPTAARPGRPRTVGFGSRRAVLVELDEIARSRAWPRRASAASALAKSRNPSPTVGTSMSRSDFSGARTRKRSVWPSGWRKPRTVTSLGTSWAATGRRARARSRTDHHGQSAQ